MSNYAACNENLPDWVLDNILKVCACGAYIADNSDTGVMTARWCPNPACPYHMAHKMVTVVKYFKREGFGPATALEYIKENKCKSHLEIISKLFPNDKPKVSLATIAQLACIAGYGSTKAEQELSSYVNFETYFETETCVSPILYLNKDLLIDAQKYFTILPPMADTRLYVMASGSFDGYGSRNDFFSALNEACGHRIHIIQTGKRKTNIFCLIKEEHAAFHEKSAIAAECHIPTYTPKQFCDIIMQALSYSNEGSDKVNEDENI